MERLGTRMGLELSSLALGVVLLAAASGVAAKPEAPGVFCDALPESAHCMGRIPDCQMCHVSTAPASWNEFGAAIQAALPRQASFAEELPAVLRALGGADSDNDGESNLDELTQGTLPGTATVDCAPTAMTRIS